MIYGLSECGYLLNCSTAEDKLYLFLVSTLATSDDCTSLLKTNKTETSSL